MTVHHCPHEWAPSVHNRGVVGWTCTKCDEFAFGIPDPWSRPGSPAIVLRTNRDTTFRVVDPSTYPHGHTTFDEEEPVHEHWARFGAGHTVVDVGACWGSYTLPALARGARVVAFEPSDDGPDIIRKSVAANGWDERMTLSTCVLWDDTPPPQALFDDVFSRHYPGTNVVARLTTLDTVLAAGARTLVDCIKIDVEGAELGVIQGGLETIRAHKPVLLVEDHEGIAPGLIVSDYPSSIDSSRRIHELLRGLGYETTDLTFGGNRKYIVAEVK